MESGLGERIEHGLEVDGIGALDGDVFAGNCGGDEESSGLDAVGNDVVLRAVKFLYALDDDAARAGTFDLGAHFDEEIGEVDDLRLFGGTVDDGRALGEDSGHHDIVRAEHGRAEFAAEIDECALQMRGEHLNVAGLHSHSGAECFEAFEVQIDRAVADDAAAGQGNRGFLFTAKQRTEDADRGAHLADDVVRGLGSDVFGLHGDRAAGALDLAAEFAEDREHVVNVAQVGNARDDAGFLREQGCGQNRKRRVL